MTNQTDKDKAKAAILLAFEAGRWLGQVDLEEHFDNDQYSALVGEYLYAAKTAMPMHDAAVGREVTIHLRSDEWREGVRKSVNEYLGKALKMIEE